MPSPPLPPAVSRRGLLLGGAGLLAVAGCSDVHVPGTTSKPPPPSPDVLVAGEAAAAITATATLVRRTTRRHPGLRAGLAPLLATHAAHLSALKKAAANAPTSKAAPLPVGAGRAAARSAVLTAEQGLVTSLTGLAMKAQSGDFARLLASMVAALDQRLTVVPG